MAFVENIKIHNFKSHIKFQSDLPSNHIVISGNNGIGKTNLLESLSFFSNSKGIRSNKLENFFFKDNPEKDIFVECSLRQENFSSKIAYKIFKHNNTVAKDFFLDEKKISNIEINKLVNFIWLSPHMDKIMYDGSIIKRKFLDKIISNLNSDFKKNLRDFKKLAEERIILLQNQNDTKWISILEEKMAKILFQILNERRNKISVINTISKKKLNKFREFKINIINEQESELEDEVLFIEKVKNILFEKRNLDTTIKRNSFGPSIDEIFFYDESKQLNTDLCSTGEQKSLLLSIILSFGWIYKDENINFILLFDEISSHIDQKNIEKFFAEVAKFETQAWYTGTNKNLFQAIENKAFFIDLA